MRWLTVLLGAAILAVIAAVVVILPDSPSSNVSDKNTSTPTASSAKSDAPTPAVSEFTDPCGKFETAKKPYAVTGYWILPKSNPCTWRHQMEEVHSVGGDTVIRIGYGLQYRAVDEEGRVLKDGVLDPLYEDCREDGLTCYRAAERDLKAAHPENRISRSYVYRTDEAFGKDVFRCSSMERTIEVGKRVYYRLITPQDGSDDATCDFAKQGRSYDLILIAASAEDSLSKLLDLGDQFGVNVFPALPLAPRNPEQPTRANETHIGTLNTLTRRIVQDYGVRFADRKSLGGVYQPFEVQMAATLAKNPTLQVYASQHTIVEQELPDKPILISPYLDARKRVGFGATPKEVAEAFKALARTGVGIIAPQDSRGTGKVGLFWPDERDSEVDERLRSVVGETTYATAYHGSTRDYYREMAAARDQMVEGGYQVELWANVEAFEPSGDKPCAPQGTRGKTDKERLDAAVAMTGRYVTKVVSYMWSDFMTCGSPSVADEIDKDHDRPIGVDALRHARDVRDGVEVRGYDLMNTTITVTWDGGAHESPSDPAAFQEQTIEDLPDGMGITWAPFDWSQVPPGTWVRIGIRAADGREAHEPLHVRMAP